MKTQSFVKAAVIAAMFATMPVVATSCAGEYVSPVSSSQKDLHTVDGIVYGVSDDPHYVSVAGFLPGNRELVVPSSVVIGKQPYVVTSVDDWAFSSDELESVMLPSSVSLVGRYVFWKCSSLRRIVLAGDKCPAAYNTAFSSELYDRVELVCPDGMVLTEPWSRFRDQVRY